MLLCCLDLKTVEVHILHKGMLLLNSMSDVKYHTVNVTESVKNTNKRHVSKTCR
jgi:hypothetical protein